MLHSFAPVAARNLEKNFKGSDVMGNLPDAESLPISSAEIGDTNSSSCCAAASTFAEAP